MNTANYFMKRNTMYTSYNGVKSRSKSTMNVSRASEEKPEVNVGSSTISRQDRRRRAQAPAPVKRARSYLSEDIRRQFEVGYENSATNLKVTPVPQSPSSNSFVKRLVATLERKHRDDNIKFMRPSENDIYSSSYRQCSKEYLEDARIRNTQPSRDQVLLERFHSDLTLPRPVRRQLEQVPERDNEDEDDPKGSNPHENQWESTSLLPKPVHIQPENTPPKASARRLIKNVLSTIVSWRGAKTLPRGSRDYYAARESLGEEMRAFRRDTMPRLIERAAMTDRFQRAAPERNYQLEFAELIGTSRRFDQHLESSIATIRPVYGSNANTRQNRLSSYQENLPNEEIYSSKKILPPATPIRDISLRPSEHLSRSSQIKDTQMQPPQEYDTVQLRRKPVNASSIYDVPRFGRRAVNSENFGRYMLEPRHKFSPPQYENISSTINDKRLRSTMFTTF